MTILAQLLVLLVALIHAYIFVLESVIWTKPYGLKTFRMDAARAETTRTLALNQGLYNLFLAAGLFWALMSGAELVPRASFFLLCVAVAGIVGAISVMRTILFIQTVPAALALIALLVAYR
jgi:putative membrane protein